MRSPYGLGTPTGQEHHVSFATGTPGRMGGGGGMGSGEGIGGSGSGDRLPNFILSAGYTPPPRVSGDVGKGSPKDPVASIYGLLPAAVSTGDVGFNERLRNKRTGESAGATPGSGQGFEGRKKQSGGFQMPRSSLLDGGTTSPASQLYRARDSDAMATTPSRTANGRTPGGRYAATPASRGGGGGLFDIEPPAHTQYSSPSYTPQSYQPARRYSSTPQSDGGDSSDRWITVFGYGPSMQSLVLREFRNYGDIVRHVNGKGNWMHILYRTPLQAQVALSKRVRVIGGEAMVGAIECTDGSMSEDGLNMTERTTEGLYGTPTRERVWSPQTPSVNFVTPSTQQTPSVNFVTPSTQPGHTTALAPATPSFTPKKIPQPQKSFWQMDFLRGW